MLFGFRLASWKCTCSNVINNQRLRCHAGRVLSKGRWTSTTTKIASPISSSTSASDPGSESGKRRWSTPLAETLAKYIATTGPISLAAYMRQCLTSPEVGYYTRAVDSFPISATVSSDVAVSAAQDDKVADQFGVKGDFVTSPEISQVFGELVGVWVVAEWMAQIGAGARPKSEFTSRSIHLIELGPGRGTLMDDMLRAISSFEQIWSLLDTIYLVEASPTLRDKQWRLLCGDKPMAKIDMGFQSFSKLSAKLKVIWVEEFEMIPTGTGSTPFIVAHEFFDALPIHAFQSTTTSEQPEEARPMMNGKQTSFSSASLTKRGNQGQSLWRELLVTCRDPSLPVSYGEEADGQPEFQLTLSKSHTYYSRILPNTSSRYKAIENNPGSVIEISPQAFKTAGLIAQHIGGISAPTSAPTSASIPLSPLSTKSRQSQPSSPQPSSTPDPLQSMREPSGAALVLDYGPSSTIPANSLRGIRAHKRVSPFTAPGTVDISADVDFTGLADAALDASPNVEVHGPVSQAAWLKNMGGWERTEALVNNMVQASSTGAGLGRDRSGAAPAMGTLMSEATATDAEVELDARGKRMIDAWKRLVDEGPTGMGRLYKVMAIVPSLGAGGHGGEAGKEGGDTQGMRVLAGFRDG